MVINSLEIQRQAMMALVMEPLVEKPGCTNRKVDLSSELSLYNFQISALNSAVYFFELGKRIKQANGQPKYYMDLFYQSLKNSNRGTTNKKYITYGLLELFFTFVIARTITSGDGIKVCKAVTKILKNSSKKDVQFLDKTRSLAWSTSKKDFKREFTKSIGGNNLFEHYSLNIDIARRVGYKTGTIWPEQLTQGMPLLQEMYLIAKKGWKLKMPNLSYLIEPYNFGLKSFSSEGAMADYIGVILYLLIAENPESAILF